VDDAMRQMLMRQMLGNGALGQTADLMKLRGIYNQEVSSGQPMPEFNEWLQLMQAQVQQPQIQLKGLLSQ
jgi:hypothetical protein